MKTFRSVEDLIYVVGFQGGRLTIEDAAGDGCGVGIPRDRRAAIRAKLDAVSAEAILNSPIANEHVAAVLFSGDLRVYAADGHVNLQILDSERDLANYVRLTPKDAKALGAQVGRSLAPGAHISHS